MCGIVGYVGSDQSLEVLLGGLKRLEYRGYDSAGVAVIGPDGTMATRKRAGKLQDAARRPRVQPHPERAHGHRSHPLGDARCAQRPERASAPRRRRQARPHPQRHHRELRRPEGRAAGTDAVFTSETDTEVAALLVGKAYRETGDLTEALRAVVNRLEGAFTLLVMHEDAPGVVVGARRNSPLVIGLGDGENFLGSDVAAFIEFTHHAVAIGQDQIVTIRPDSVEVIDFDGNEVETEPFEVTWDASASDKGGWSSFMAKEISEEPEAVANTLLGRVHDGIAQLDELEPLAASLDQIDRVIVIACGTAAYAGMLGKYAIEQWSRIPVEVELSHEFRYRNPILNERTLVVSISQSGETMDTLMAVRFAKESGAKVLSICNTQGASIPRESDAVIYTHAGPEVAVASTKAFVAQADRALPARPAPRQEPGQRWMTRRSATTSPSCRRCPTRSPRCSSSSKDIGQLAHWMTDVQSVIYLGRNVGYPVALEGALKLKELAYIHAEGFAAGELKHGPIALIEPGQVVFVIVPSPRDPNSLHPKVVSSIEEIRARGARVIAIAEKGDAAVLPFADEVIPIPLADSLFEPILAVVPLHIFGMELAAAKGLDVDQPRNLAKSVTVGVTPRSRRVS